MQSLCDPQDLEPYYELRLVKHGSKTFESFKNMWQRLHQISSVGRYVGVQVDPSWVSYKKFLSDMGERPLNTTLDRIDPKTGYCKENCRWADVFTQQANRRNSIWVFDGDEELVLEACCRKHGLNYPSVWSRLKHGWTIDEALSTPIGKTGVNSSRPRISTGKFSLVAKGQ